MRTTQVTRDTLNAAMEFDHVITISHDGKTVSDASPDIWAPEVIDASDIRHPVLSAREGQTWELLSGYSGQYNYSGPIMHASEFIGGSMADDILSEPGVYVAITVSADGNDDDGSDGWAVARLIEY